MSRPILEVIALGPEDAAAAQAGGADRLELVSDMAADGLTPAVETFARVRAACDLPVRVMLRASNDFSAGGAAGIDALCATAEALRAEGASEYVLGFLDEDGRADVAAVAAVVAVLGADARWTFHRAIDRAADRDAVREQLAGQPGLDTYLTAGSASGVEDGLGTLVAEAGRRVSGPRILVGGGLALQHVPVLLAAGIDGFHIGSAARPGGWEAAVDAGAVGVWRQALDGA
ncbi:copper homeostasis protein CutC [Streptomyces caatingaensis]|uniref:Copper homeostasis protein cutC homolog n=1 Tax=Streptomyces caatingaensis TaxID=1678637 RepID=A0A0K9XFU9_9ACTN|nr:copper homeostasis protein CutC [Streptomyces caatingaensis]KNB51961.1 copper homeostasis protein CutC [Streptomyces caatingaensis]